METTILKKVCSTCGNVGYEPGPCGWSMEVCKKWGYIIGVETDCDDGEDCIGWKENSFKRNIG